MPNHDAPKPLIVITKIPATTAKEHHDVGAVIVTSRQVSETVDQSRHCFPNKGEFSEMLGSGMIKSQNSSAMVDETAPLIRFRDS